MSEALRQAAQQALQGMPSEGDEGDIRRLTVDVEMGGTSELVTLRLQDGKLSWTSTGAPEGPHVRAALRWLATDEPAPASAMRSAGEQRISLVPPEGPEVHTTPTRGQLADALSELVTVLVRAGVSEGSSPSVSESLERLAREAPTPMPLGLSRWLGRLRGSIERKDVGDVAALLDAAGRLAEDLLRDKPAPAARRRIAGWLGGDMASVERVSDRRLLEIARERLPGVDRSSIQRRYLLDVQNGEIFCEESTGRTRASVGPCPRVCEVGLAEVEQGSSPRRIRPMQYTVTLGLSPNQLTRVEETGYRRFAPLADRHRQALTELPGQAEPFVVIVPARFRSGELPVAFCAEGSPLPFSRVDDPSAVEVLAKISESQSPRWIAGRLVDVEGALMMVPCSVGVAGAEGPRIVRLR
ncbi:MAG: hypothetical protein AB8I08_31830 [Sandaracinaceae bacterium]